MKSRHPSLWYFCIAILLWLVSLAGCAPSIGSTAVPSSVTLPSAVYTSPSSLVPPTLSPSLTSTRTPEPPTLSSAPTRTPELPTLTARPTLTADRAQALVLDLLENNAGCQLPCWWGFTPGETTWQTAHNFLASFATRIAGAKSSGDDTTYTARFQVPNQISQDYISQHYTVINGTIEMIWANMGNSHRYMLPQLLATHGQPAEVRLRTFSSVPDGDELPFFLMLFYPHQGILVMYSGFTYERDGQIPVCPQQTGGVLWLWSPEREMAFEDFVPVEEGPEYRSLEEATGWSIEQFYQTFVDPTNQTCLKTPADMW